MYLRQRPIFKVALILFSVNAALLGGCQEVAPPSSPEVSRPVPILEIAGTASTSGLRFPGRVQATQRAELAFNVPGRVVEFPAEEGETLSEDEVRTFCKDHIAYFKVPRYIWFVDAFPMTVTGKLQKFRMREMAIERLGGGKAAAGKRITV